MYTSKLYFPTIKEDPNDAELISHKLMLRAGLIRKLSSGIYTWLPLGLKVLRKIENIIRAEMQKINAQEILMPAICPAELWQESGRWDIYGPLLLRIKDRNKRDFCFGPTHEEVVTDLIRHEVKSYKQLPITLYQIQTKFRDEIRPRFGVMRGREFLMKDAYSFHLDETSLEKSYQEMYQAYSNIFNQLDLDFRPVEADNGDIGGSISHEFQVLAESGEDLIACSDSSDYAANIEKAGYTENNIEFKDFNFNSLKQSVEIAGITETKEQAKKLNVDLTNLLKTIIVTGSNPNQPYIALVLCGNHEINTLKINKISSIKMPLELVSPEIVTKVLGCELGFIGPLELDKFNIPVIIDYSAAKLKNFSCGANQTNKMHINANWNDCQNLDNLSTADLRFLQNGDHSPDGQGKIVLKRGIEVGQVFKLGTKYSAQMNANVLDNFGKSKNLLMGCYGIGVSRTLAACIEQNHDENGIIWPKLIAPFTLSIIPIFANKNPKVQEFALDLYNYLSKLNIDILLEDRNERPGVLFAEHDLIGIPFRVVISIKNLELNKIEFKARNQSNSEELLFNNLSELVTMLKTKINL